MSEYIVDLERTAGEDYWSENIYKGENKLKVLEKWFEANAVFPNCVSINCYTKEEALDLLKFAWKNISIVHTMYFLFGSPYKWDYIEDGIKKKLEDGCQGFFGEPDWMTDMIHPFDIG